MVTIIHHNDLDGKCAGHVAYEFEMDQAGGFARLSLFEINYGIPFPFEEIEEGEKVYLLDYSIEPEEMERLLTITKNVVWIDHHITAIEKYKDFPHDIQGIRTSDGRSGCVLTHQYLYPNEEVPEWAELIGDRDVWNWIHGMRTKFYCSGIEMLDLNPVSEDWLKAKDIGAMTVAGRNVEQYKTQRNKEYLKNYAFRTQFEDHEAIIVNIGMVGSEIFDSVEDLPPLQIMYTWDGKMYKVSLQSTTLNVAEIAKKYGGGGHAGASGFECTELPWEKS